MTINDAEKADKSIWAEGCAYLSTARTSQRRVRGKWDIWGQATEKEVFPPRYRLIVVRANGQSYDPNAEQLTIEFTSEDKIETSNYSLMSAFENKTQDIFVAMAKAGQRAQVAGWNAGYPMGKKDERAHVEIEQAQARDAARGVHESLQTAARKTGEPVGAIAKRIVTERAQDVVSKRAGGIG